MVPLDTVQLQSDLHARTLGAMLKENHRKICIQNEKWWPSSLFVRSWTVRSAIKLQKMHVDSLVVRYWMVFLKTRPFVKRNNAEFTNVSSFTSLLMGSTHFTLSCRILPFSLPSTNNCFKFVYSEITGESAWWVLFRPPWCCLPLWQLKVIRTWLTSILDFWYPQPSYFAQEVLVLHFFVCIYCPVHKKCVEERTV